MIGLDRLPVYGEDGPVIDPQCPGCGWFLRTRGSRVYIDGDWLIRRFQGVECARCGSIQPRVLGWAADFEDFMA